MQLNEASFTVSPQLADGTTLRGTFKVKLRLSFRDILRMDAYRRDLLGKNPEIADTMVVAVAEKFSKIWTHVIESPSWWKDAGNGIDLDEAAPITEVYEAIERLEKEHYEATKKKAEDAKVELKKTVSAE